MMIVWLFKTIGNALGMHDRWLMRIGPLWRTGQEVGRVIRVRLLEEASRDACKIHGSVFVEKHPRHIHTFAPITCRGKLSHTDDHFVV